jgi:hypothetical protein
VFLRYLRSIFPPFSVFNWQLFAGYHCGYEHDAVLEFSEAGVAVFGLGGEFWVFEVEQEGRETLLDVAEV